MEKTERLKEFELLTSIGLNKTEAKVYLTLLEIGPTTTGPIIGKARVSSSKIYSILSRLQEKGLVSFILKEKTKYFQASSPDALISYAEEQEAERKKQKDELCALIPSLNAIYKTKKNSGAKLQEAQFYSGWKGVMTAFQTALESVNDGGQYIGFVQTFHEEVSKDVKRFFAQYQKQRERKRLTIRLLAGKDQKKVFSKEPYLSYKNFNVRYIDATPPGLVIFKEQLLLSAFGENPIAVLIHSKEIAASYKHYFESLWTMKQ